MQAPACTNTATTHAQDTLLYGYGEMFTEQIIGWKCLAPELCTDDLRTSYGNETSMPDDWNIAKQSCLTFTTWDLGNAPGAYTCYM